jgi:hypothetical protein
MNDGGLLLFIRICVCIGLVLLFGTLAALIIGVMQ